MPRRPTPVRAEPGLGRSSTGLGRLFDGDPFRTLQQEMDNLISTFSRDWNGGGLIAGEFQPLLDVSEADDVVQVRVDLPGIKPEEVNVAVRGNVLQITGERKQEKEENGKTFHRVERRVGRFARAMTLPCAVKEDQVQAECSDGVLNITLPKAETEKTQKITVKGK